MTAIVLHLTNAGLAAVEGLAGSDTMTIAGLALTATPFTVAPTLTALPGEFKRIAAVAGTEAAPNITHMTAYDTSADVWNATGLGLFAADGTLFAVYSSGTTIISKASAAFALIALDIAFDADLAASISFGNPIFTSPPATEDMRGIIEIADAGEAAAGVDLLRALVPGRAKASVLGWLLTQDGAGSGLDADLLDGQHGAWYADIAARLGYTPLNAASYTAADVKTKLLTVDGSGSGLDADLLDGQDSAYYTNITARLGFTPLNAAAYTAIDVLAKLLGVDGAGSGLDADLLDGQHGAWYADIAARLGYTPLNAASYTAADVLSKVLTVDGSGSGLDADALDGQDGAWYADIAGRLGYTPANRAGDSFTGLVEFQTPNVGYTGGIRLKGNPVSGKAYLQVTDSAVSAQWGVWAYDATGLADWNGAGGLKVNGNIAWHAANDGSGSGLDADLLDGQHGAYYADVISRLGFTPLVATPGAVALFAMNAAPAGYLACDGAAVSRAGYAALFAAIGTTFGVGDGASTFNLPDLRGEFVRGWDAGRGVDAGRAFGSTQADDLASHHHLVPYGPAEADVLTTTTNGNAATGNIQTSDTGGTETRPRNVALLYCIKT